MGILEALKSTETSLPLGVICSEYATLFFIAFYVCGCWDIPRGVFLPNDYWVLEALSKQNWPKPDFKAFKSVLDCEQK